MNRKASALFGLRGLVPSILAALILSNCGPEVAEEPAPTDPIRIGAALPFSGPKASTGINLERALMLAVEDVNRAGGVDGRQLVLKVRDSNSGTDRGLTELRRLMEEDDVAYLVGPEEDNLALALVRDVKRLNRMQFLAGFTSPTITDSGSQGAWVRMVPSVPAIGCALATKATVDGITSTRTIAERDDYHLELATLFGSTMSALGGKVYPTVTVAGGEASYKKAVSQIDRYQSDATLMLTYPATAATIMKEMARSGDVRWYLSPMLRDDALAWNVPKGILDNSVGVSPSLSTDGECVQQRYVQGITNPAAESGTGIGGAAALAQLAKGPPTSIDECEADSASQFKTHFAERWSGAEPLDSAHFYYDAVMILALNLQRAASAGETNPSPKKLLGYLSEDDEGAEEVPWHDFSHGLSLARQGELVHYIGAAGEYQFSPRGDNLRTVVDTWVVDGEQQFVRRESVICRQLFLVQ